MTFKDIIFAGMEEKLDNENITMLTFVYDFSTKVTKALAKSGCGEIANVKFTKSENMIIRSMLINKITRQCKKDYPEEYLQLIIINIDNVKKEIDIFLKFTNNRIVKL